MIWYLNGDPVQKNQKCAVPLGIQGETHSLSYTADVSDWLALWPSGVVALVLQAPDGSEPYMGDTAIDRETGIVTWTITEFDTAVVGYGKGELRLVEDGVVKKSYTFATYVVPSVMSGLAEPPAPTPEWIDEMLEAAAGVQGAIDAANEAKTAAEAAEAAALESENNARISANEAGASATNALAFADRAEAAADAAETSADRAEQAAQNAGYMDFYIDEDGHLIYQRTDQVEVDFTLSNGRLLAVWE